MKVKDWQKTAQLVWERQSQTATTDTSELSSFSLSELPVDQSGPPTVIHRPYVPLSTSRDNQQTTEAAQDESSFQQVIPNISQQSLYPSLVVMGTSINTAISPSISLSRRVINDIEEHKRRVLMSNVEGTNRGTNTKLWMNKRRKSQLQTQDKRSESPKQKCRKKLCNWSLSK